jgi:hypothetical protein
MSYCRPRQYFNEEIVEPFLLNILILIMQEFLFIIFYLSWACTRFNIKFLFRIHVQENLSLHFGL